MPFVAAPGRDVRFGTGVLSEHSRRLSQMTEQPHIQIHPDDAATQGIGNGDQVLVTSANGKLELAAKITPKARVGQIVVYVGYSENPAHRLAGFPVDGQAPDLKAIPVRVQRIGGPVPFKATSHSVKIDLPVLGAPLPSRN